MLRIRSEEVGERVHAATSEEEARLREDVKALARPRMAGSEGAGEVDAELRTRIEEAGYRIRELPFEYSAFPGRFGLPVIGGVMIAGAGTGIGLLLAGYVVAAAATLGVTLLVAVLLGLVGFRAVSWLPFGRATGTNWLVQRDGVEPRFLIVAHRDTKSQLVSTYLRIAGIVAAVAGTLLLLLLALLGIATTDVLWAPMIIGFGIVAVLGGVVLCLSWSGNDSPGALDNASGLAAALGLARRMKAEDDVAFLFTDAEELGLAGARAVIPDLPPVRGLVNIDGLDDHGPYYLIERQGWIKPRGIAPHLAATLLAAADALGIELRRRNLPIGLLVDHIAFVRAGLPAVTLMRGTGASLRRVHRPGDDPGRLRGDGIGPAVALVEGALALLRLPPPPREKILPDSLVGPREPRTRR